MKLIGRRVLLLALCAALSATDLVAAGHIGTLGAVALDFTPHGSQPGLVSPLVPSGACLNCHASGSPADQAFMPYNTWAGTMMANATRDPLFWAALDVANHDAPGVGDYCLRCHAPRGWFSGRVAKDGTGGFVDGQNGCLLRGDHDDLETTATNDFDGLGCQSCHRLMANGPNGETAPRGGGNIWLDGASSVSCGTTSNPCMRGPYDYSVDRNAKLSSGCRGNYAAGESDRLATKIVGVATTRNLQVDEELSLLEVRTAGTGSVGAPSLTRNAPPRRDDLQSHWGVAWSVVPGAVVAGASAEQVPLSR